MLKLIIQTALILLPDALMTEIGPWAQQSEQRAGLICQCQPECEGDK